MAKYHVMSLMGLLEWVYQFGSSTILLGLYNAGFWVDVEGIEHLPYQ